MATTIALWLWFIGWALVLARLDIRGHRLPNRMVAVCFAGCAIATLVHAIVISDITAIVTPAVASVAAAGVFRHRARDRRNRDGRFQVRPRHRLDAVHDELQRRVGGACGRVCPRRSRGHRWVAAARVAARASRPFRPFMGLGVIVAGAAALGSVG